MHRVTRIRSVTAVAAGLTVGMLCALASGCGAAVLVPRPVAATTGAAGSRPTVRASLPTTDPTAGPTTAPTNDQSPTADRLEVDTCWTNATATTGGQLLISARSSDPGARLRAYRADGSLIGEVHNGGGQRYGGTVFAYERHDPGPVTIRSSSGGSISVPTTAFRPES